ncbi:MAG: AI-2E family transporter [Candidatus Nanohaloarchaea archaeon]
MDEEKSFLVGVILLLGVIGALMLRPFAAYVLGAILLSFILMPLHRRLNPYTGERISSLFLVFFSIFIVVMPLFLVGAAVIDDARDLNQQIGDFETVNITNIEQKIADYTGQEVDIESNLRKALQEFTSLAFGSFSQILNLFTNLAIGLSLMLFLMYYFIKDGEAFMEWLKGMVPLPDELQETLYEKINFTTWAVIKGHVLVAIVQGLVAGVGLYLAGVPNYVFWTFIMLILAFLPIIGSFLVWGPASVYLFLKNEPAAGTFLLVYGIVAVGLTDNFLRPLLVDKRAELHPATIIIGVLGGVFIFGAPGLFIGPILLGVLKSVLAVFKNNY